MARTIDQHSADIRDQLPEPGDTPFEHLRHTVATFADSVHEGDVAIMATSSIYGEGVVTGLTWGDLATILDWLEKSEEHLRPNHPTFR